MHEHARATHPRRLFTALFPDAACREALDRLRRGWLTPGARAAPACQRLHLTLQFCAQASAAQEADWLAGLAELQFAPFTLQLVRAQVWRHGHNELVVLRPQRCAPLLALQEQTAAIARQAGIAPPGRRFKPHLTLLRRAELARTPTLDAPIAWPVHTLSLVHSDLQRQPPRYHALRRIHTTPHKPAPPMETRTPC